LIGRYLSNRSTAAPAVLPPAQHTISRRWRTFVLAILVLGGVLARPGNVSAQGHWAWAPLGVGCARSISVGPNGVPWILGCTGGDPNGTGPAWVYYLSWSNPTGSLFPTYQWNYDHISGVTLYVNLNGIPYVTDVVGNVWYEAADSLGLSGGKETPTGQWWLGRPCCVGAIAVGVTATIPPTHQGATGTLNAGEMFYQRQTNTYTYGETFAWTQAYGAGCAGVDSLSCPGGPFYGLMIWQAMFPSVQFEPWACCLQQFPWDQLSPLAGIVTLTMFTNPDNSVDGTAKDVSQSLWALDVFAQVFFWQCEQYAQMSCQSGQWVRVDPLPGEAGALWITDGALLGYSSGALYWCSNMPHCTAADDWTYLIAPYTTNGVHVSLKQIAMGGSVSQAIAGLSPAGVLIQSLPPYNPIAWAIDYEGKIYFSQWVYVGPNQ
jgi:hypothetical protein